MKRTLVILLFAATGTQLKAQQLQTSSLYDIQGVFNNPSMAGTSESNFAGVTYRTQWSNISGSPRTATLFGSMSLPAQKIGLGGYLYSDKTGPTSRTGIQLAFAKHIPMANGGKFSFGIEARGLQFSIDRAKLQESLGSDPVLGSSDNRFKFDAGFGVSYSGKKMQLGASVSQLIQSKLDFYNGNLSRNEEGRLYRHYYFHGSYKWNLDESTTINPNFLITYLPNAPTEYQFGARVTHEDLFWWGVGYRIKQSFMLSAGVNLNKKYVIGYSFDMYKTPNSTFDGGASAHELILRYNFLK